MAAVTDLREAARLDPRIPRTMRIRRAHRETRDTWTLESVAADGVPATFRPGQFAMLYAPGVGEVPISFSGDPALPGVATHTIRAVGPVSRALCALRPGQAMGWRGPYGRPWPLEDVPAGADVVVVAGGIGLAPLRPAVLRLLADRARFGRVVLLYGARTPGELLFRHEVERWRGRLDVQVEVTVDYGDEEWHGNVGVVTTLIPRATFDAGQAVALVCGPEVMMRFAAIEMEKRGVPPEAIYVSMERNMKCAIGHCGHCQFGSDFVCRDGPVATWARLCRRIAMREI
jgi:NAD(P)H-flavin reductase